MVEENVVHFLIFYRLVVTPTLCGVCFPSSGLQVSLAPRGWRGCNSVGVLPFIANSAYIKSRRINGRLVLVWNEMGRVARGPKKDDRNETGQGCIVLFCFHHAGRGVETKRNDTRLTERDKESFHVVSFRFVPTLWRAVVNRRGPILLLDPTFRRPPGWKKK